MPRRKIEGSPEIVAELERRRAHGDGYEDGIWKRTPRPWAEEASPRALAYLIGYKRGLEARAEIVVKVNRGSAFRELPELRDDDDEG
jgi:hypothetical protein